MTKAEGPSKGPAGSTCVVGEELGGEKKFLKKVPRVPKRWERRGDKRGESRLRYSLKKFLAGPIGVY